MDTIFERRWSWCGVLMLLLLACSVAASDAVPEGTVVIGDNPRIVLDVREGLGASRIEGHEAGKTWVIADHVPPRRLFQIAVAGEHGETHIESVKMQVTDTGGSPASGHLTASHPDSGILTRLQWRQSEAGQVELSLAVQSPSAMTVHLVWPVLEGLLPDSDADSVHYFHPRSSGIYSNQPADIASNYGQYVRMQVMGCFRPDGAGLYVINADPDIRRRSFELTKQVPGLEPAVLHDDYGFPFWLGLAPMPGVGMAIQTRDLELRAAEGLELPPVTIGLTREGGVVEALRRYREWAGSWYDVERTDWFREAFNYRAARIFTYATPENVIEAYEDDTIDFLHYMVQARHLNGEYGVREDWGVAGVRALIDALHERGVRSSHYLEGYSAHETSAVYQEHGDHWGQKRGGQNVVSFANMAMCPAAEGWHQWLADVSTRLVTELGFDVIYLDCLGFGTLDKYVCENPNHEHPPKWEGIRGAQALLGHVRSALHAVRPGTPLVTEGPAVDRLFTVLDGVQDYGCRDAHRYPQWYSTPIHWLRFVYPDFKFFDIPIGDASEQSWQIKRVLFNGCGLCTSGQGPTLSGRSATRDLEKRATLLWRDHHDALSSENVTPMLPTEHHGVYANRFEADTKAIVTMCNANDFPVAGELISLPLAADERLVDVWQHREPPTRSAHGVTKVALEMGPQDVTVLARMPRIIEATQYGLMFSLNAPAHRTVIRRVGADGLTVPWREVDGQIAFDLVEATDQGRRRAVALAVRDGVAVDEVVLPQVGEVNLADFAEIASSNDGGVISSGTVRWDLPADDEHPGWLELSWSVPQPVNTCRYRFSRGQYTPQDWSLQYRDPNGAWVTLAVKSDGADDYFGTVETTALRIVVRRGGVWGNRCFLTDWKVGWMPLDEVRGSPAVPRVSGDLWS